MTQNFTVACYQNEYLPMDGREVNAIISVTANGQVGLRAPSLERRAEVIILDVSGSMAGEKLIQTRVATEAALSCVKDGTRFGIIAGNEKASQVFPASGLVPATVRTRRQAVAAVARLRAEGGTAIGEWVSLANRLLATAGGVRHAILLTDGRDEHETPEALHAALTVARGGFQCDCRGVGTDWSVAELRQVADALLGSVEIIADPANLDSDFRNVMQSSMRRAHSDVRIRVWTPSQCEPVLKQVSPEVRDLASLRTQVAPGTVEYALGAWETESRDFHLSIRVPIRDVGDELLAARVAVAADGVQGPTCVVRAIWTEDSALSTRVNRQVAHFSGQQEIATAIQEGLDARRQGDDDTATTKLGMAARLAAAFGHTDTVALLERVVEVDDWQTGEVRLKPQVELIDEMTLETRSTRTIRVRS